MALKGKQQEGISFSKKIGIEQFKLRAINPSLEELKKLYPNYTGEKEPVYTMDKSDDKGDYTLSNIILYLEDSEGIINKTNILLSTRIATSKEGKTQYVNTVGQTVWATSKEDVKSMVSNPNLSDGYKSYIQSFLKRDYREAYNGEEQLLDFILKYSRIDTRDPEAELIFNMKKLFAGDYRELQKELLIPSFADHKVISIYEIVSKKIESSVDENTGEITPESFKHYQGIYNRFLPDTVFYAFDPTYKKAYPTFVQNWYKQLIGQYGSKNYFAKKVGDNYVLELVRDYVEGENPIDSASGLHTSEDTSATTSSPDPLDHIGPKDDLPF